MQQISSQAQASAAAEDGRAAAGTSSDGSRPGSAAIAAGRDSSSAAAAAAAATNNVVMDKLAGLQQLVRAEAHKQQEVFDNTLKVIYEPSATAVSALFWICCNMCTNDVVNKRGRSTAA